MPRSSSVDTVGAARDRLLNALAQLCLVGEKLNRINGSTPKSPYSGRAVAALITAVTVPAFVVLIVRRRSFKLCAGEIVQQDLGARPRTNPASAGRRWPRSPKSAALCSNSMSSIERILLHNPHRAPRRSAIGRKLDLPDAAKRIVLNLIHGRKPVTITALRTLYQTPTASI